MSGIEKENVRRQYLHNRHNGNSKAPLPMKRAIEPEYTKDQIAEIRRVAIKGVTKVKTSDGVKFYSARVVIQPMEQLAIVS